MPLRPLWTLLVFAAACLTAVAARADELADIEKLYHEGKVSEALLKADAALATQPRLASLRFLKGVMLLEQKREDEALQIFTALTQDYPELPDPYNNLAVIYASKGQLQSALVALQSALRNDPEHRVANDNLGDIHLLLAQQAWAKAQALSKGDDAAIARKLRLTQEILPVSAPVPVLKQKAAPPPTAAPPLLRSQGLDSSAGRRASP